VRFSHFWQLPNYTMTILGRATTSMTFNRIFQSWAWKKKNRLFF